MESDDTEDGRPFTNLGWQALKIVRRLKSRSPSRYATFDDDDEHEPCVIPLPKRPDAEAPGKVSREESPKEGMHDKPGKVAAQSSRERDCSREAGLLERASE